MSHPHFEMPAAIYAAYEQASKEIFHPRAAVRSSGEPMFRSKLSRDLGCLLDVDRHVVAWLCLPTEIVAAGVSHVPDFLVDYDDGSRSYLDAVEEEGDSTLTEAAAIFGARHGFVSRREMEATFRLQNARDLLRYANYRTPLNDRVRLLAALDEHGSLSVAECLGVFREVQPMTAISWMFLNRMIEIDLDSAVIGPDTVLRRFYR